jgi:hypothetical protein
MALRRRDVAAIIAPDISDMFGESTVASVVFKLPRCILSARASLPGFADFSSLL